MTGTLPGPIGRYQVTDRLGGGGMGVVYIAYDPVIDRKLALKVLRTALDDDESRDRFRREARAAGRLTHPNIVTIFDAGEHDGQPFIAMEYIAGTTVAKLIEQRSSLSLARKLDLLHDLSNGLSYAHAAGLIHRDIKPANLIVDSTGRLRILDFGIARITDSALTGNTVVGTPSYMAPEQVGGGRVDRRSDIFAVGCVLYELISFRKAFAGESNNQIFHRILNEQPPRLGSICPGLDPTVERIVARALEKDPAARYQRLSDLWEEAASVRARLAQTEDADTILTPPVAGGDAVQGHTPAPPTPRGIDRGALAQRRLQQIESHLASAREALETSQFEIAVAAAEQALLLDPNSERAVEIIEAARSALDGHQVEAWVAEGRAALARVALAEARKFAQWALERKTDSGEAASLLNAVVLAEREQQIALERARLVQDGFDRVRQLFAEGRLDSALRAVDEVLTLDPKHAAARSLREELQTATTARVKTQAARALADRDASLHAPATATPGGASASTGSAVQVPQIASETPASDASARTRTRWLVAGISLALVVTAGGWFIRTQLGGSRTPDTAGASSPDEVSALLEGADRALRENRFVDALQGYEAILARQPDHAAARAGVARAQAGRDAERREAEQRAIGTATESADAALARGDLDEAERLYRSARDRGAAEGAAKGLEVVRLLRQAKTLADQRFLDDAIKKFDDVLKIAPGNAVAIAGKRNAAQSKILGPRR
jgi:tetratricopeptide (TPR) repeat protein